MSEVAATVELPEGYSVHKDDDKKRFFFRTPDGVDIGSHASMDFAEAAAERHYRRSLAVLRPCITCRDTFKSLGPGNRMCPTCRATKTDTSGGC